MRLLNGYTTNPEVKENLWYQIKYYHSGLASAARSCYPFWELSQKVKKGDPLFKDCKRDEYGRVDLRDAFSDACVLYQKYPDPNVKMMLENGENELSSWLANVMSKLMAHPIAAHYCQELVDHSSHSLIVSEEQVESPLSLNSQ